MIDVLDRSAGDLNARESSQIPTMTEPKDEEEGANADASRGVANGHSMQQEQGVRRAPFLRVRRPRPPTQGSFRKRSSKRIENPGSPLPAILK